HVFFFQAEDGIRDLIVTGVQTCALPICVESHVGRATDMALYTGNDDTILMDLLTEYAAPTASGKVRLRIVGGLLGHWACWTQTRSEERRLGKEGRKWGGRDDRKKEDRVR